jgi:hypothetical protein
VSLPQASFLMMVWRLQRIPQNKWIWVLQLLNFLPHTAPYPLYQFKHENIPPVHVSVRSCVLHGCGDGCGHADAAVFVVIYVIGSSMIESRMLNLYLLYRAF